MSHTNTKTHPREYLSPSQYTLWKKSPAQYAKSYFADEKPFVTKYMQAGNTIEDALVTDELLKDELLECTERQSEIRCTINGVPVYGKMDFTNPEMSQIVEIKSSKNRWSREQAETTAQRMFYQVGVHEMKGIKSPFRLIWIETDLGTAGEVITTGEYQAHDIEYPTDHQVQAFREDIAKVWAEIGEAFGKFNKGEPVDEAIASAIYETQELNEIIDNAKTRIDEIKAEVTPLILAGKPSKIEGIGSFYSVKSESWDYSKSSVISQLALELEQEDKALEEMVKAMRDHHAEQQKSRLENLEALQKDWRDNNPDALEVKTSIRFRTATKK